MTTTPRRKIRADAKLEQLNEAQRERLLFWFDENCTYREVVELVRKEFGLSVGRSAVSAYYRRHVLSVQQQDEAEIVTEFAALPAADFDQATLQRAKALLWSALAQINPDVELAAKLSAIIEKAERRALAIRKLDLEERKVAVREKLAAERMAKAERAAKAEVRTTKHTKRHERGGESAEVVGRSEGCEVAAKAQSGEGRSKGAEGAVRVGEGVGEVVTLTAGGGGASVEVCPSSTRSRSPLQEGSELAEQKNAGEGSKLPRFSGYSEVERAQEEAAKAELGTTKDAEKMKDETSETRKTGKAEASAAVMGRSEGAEVAARAQSSEGRSKGAEGANLTGASAPANSQPTRNLRPNSWAEFMQHISPFRG